MLDRSHGIVARKTTSVEMICTVSKPAAVGCLIHAKHASLHLTKRIARCSAIKWPNSLVALPWTEARGSFIKSRSLGTSWLANPTRLVISKVRTGYNFIPVYLCVRLAAHTCDIYPMILLRIEFRVCTIGFLQVLKFETGISLIPRFQRTIELAERSWNSFTRSNFKSFRNLYDM